MDDTELYRLDLVQARDMRVTGDLHQILLYIPFKSPCFCYFKVWWTHLDWVEMVYLEMFKLPMGLPQISLHKSWTSQNLSQTLAHGALSTLLNTGFHYASGLSSRCWHWLLMVCTTWNQHTLRTSFSHNFTFSLQSFLETCLGYPLHLKLER